MNSDPEEEDCISYSCCLGVLCGDFDQELCEGCNLGRWGAIRQGSWHRYPGTDPRFNKVFSEGMRGPTAIIVNQVLEKYRGFEKLTELVDVRGGVGITLNLITAKYTHIRGINFDLPHVVTDAPTYPGFKQNSKVLCFILL